jgi:flagellar basal-body rod protein FlgF
MEANMRSGMLDAVRGCLKEELRMDIISSNLANSAVLGFKKDRISFQEFLGRAQRTGGTDIIDRSLIGIRADYAQGDNRHTGNSLDFAIQGKGFFKVETPGGIRYTRRGNFMLNRDGNLVTQEGYKVLGGGGPVTITGSNVSVDGKGTVKVDGSEVGRIEVIDFQNYDGLAKTGTGFFRNYSQMEETAPPPETSLEQGYLELSNVNMVDEMVQMIHCLRAFESYQKAIQTLDGLNQRAVNEVSRLR